MYIVKYYWLWCWWTIRNVYDPMYFFRQASTFHTITEAEQFIRALVKIKRERKTKITTMPVRVIEVS